MAGAFYLINLKDILCLPLRKLYPCRTEFNRLAESDKSLGKTGQLAHLRNARLLAKGSTQEASPRSSQPRKCGSHLACDNPELTQAIFAALLNRQ